jgi:outer membrane receptor protein involved in Fe transport
VRIEHDISDQLTVNVTPYGRINEMDFLLHFLPSQALEENGHKSIGALTSLYWSFDDSSEITIGADFEATDGFLRETQSRPSFGSFPQGPHYDYDLTAIVVALYGHAEWQATDSVRVIGGVRWEYTDYDYDNKLTSDTVGRFQRPADRTDSYSVVTPKFGVVWDVRPDTSLFANYARGARAPQTTDLYRLQINQAVGDIREEKLDSFEIGARGEIAGVSYQAAAFYMTKRNFFFRDTDGFNVPDGKTKHKGVELEVVIPLHETLDLAAAATYARHTYNFTNLVTANSTESISEGNDVDTAPRVTSNVRLIWRPTERIQGEIEWVHVGRYYTDASNLHDYPGHDVLNVRFVWQAHDNVDLFFTGRNLTNKAYAERADFSFGSERYLPGETRAFEGGVNFHF